ncbi:MAG: CapA family protein [Lachnospiraceae bacterium]|nr:CapA family protein [Lachnospiraceae bacterium]
MKKFQALLIVLMISLIALVGVAVYADYKVSDKEPATQKTTTESTEEKTTEEPTTEPTTEPEPQSTSVKLVAVGDILIHTPLLAEGLQEDGSYDFKFLFEIMKSDFESADIAVVNQESVLGGPELGYDGYPNFNSPDEVGDAIVDAGFDVVLQATNHSMDVRIQGVHNTIEYWKKKGDAITMLGFNETAEELCKPKYIEKNGIKFAMFNYTYGLNGYVLPEGEEYRVNLLDDSNRELIVSEIQKAKEEADFVIVFPHWGNEDWLGEPSDWQKNWANIFTDAGVDLIIGAHPHVLEKVEWIETEAGNKSLCYYSVGNYISNQQELNEVLGGMATVTIIKDETGTYIDEENTGMVPIVTQNDRRGAKPLIQTYRLSDYTEEMAKIHDIYNRFDSSFSLERLQNTANEVLGDWIK